MKITDYNKFVIIKEGFSEYNLYTDTGKYIKRFETIEKCTKWLVYSLEKPFHLMVIL